MQNRTVYERLTHALGPWRKHSAPRLLAAGLLAAALLAGCDVSEGVPPAATSQPAQPAEPAQPAGEGAAYPVPEGAYPVPESAYPAP